jgi:long-chain acyl-CoA synthetase
VYATLGISAVVEVVNEGGLKVLLCNRSAIGDLAQLRHAMPSLTHLIVSDDAQLPAAKAQPLPKVEGLTVLSVGDVVVLGQASAAPPAHPKPDSVAVVMYTSGSTGTPKGVVIEHAQLLATVAAVRNQDRYYDDSGLSARADTVLCYLPLAHIFELGNELVALSCGARSGREPRHTSSTTLKALCVLFQPALFAEEWHFFLLFFKGRRKK